LINNGFFLVLKYKGQKQLLR